MSTSQADRASDRFDFLLDDEDVAHRERVQLGDPGGFGTTYRYEVDEEVDGQMRKTRYAVKTYDASFIYDKEIENHLLVIWNEWLGLRNVQMPHLIHGCALRTDPPLPDYVLDAMTNFVSKNKLSAHNVTEEVGNILGMIDEELLQKPFRIALAMEYFESVDLKSFILAKKAEKVKYSVFQSILYQAVKALSDLHEVNICHLDIKPDNYLYREGDGLLKLCDFGSLGHTAHIAKCYAWTKDYDAPERINAPTSKADVFSLGKTIRHLLEIVDWDCVEDFVTKETKQNHLQLLRKLIAQMTSKRCKDRPRLAKIISDYSATLFAGVDTQAIESLAMADALNVARYYGVRHSPAPTLVEELNGSHTEDRLSILDALPYAESDFPASVITTARAKAIPASPVNSSLGEQEEPAKQQKERQSQLTNTTSTDSGSRSTTHERNGCQNCMDWCCAGLCDCSYLN